MSVYSFLCYKKHSSPGQDGASKLSRAHDASAAVDGDGLAGDERRSAGRQEDDHRGDLVDAADAADGVRRFAVLQEWRVPEETD